MASRSLRPVLRSAHPVLRRGHAGCSGHHPPAGAASASSASSSSAASSTPRPTQATAAASAAIASARSAGAPSGSGGPQKPAAYCADLVRRLDPDAWLCSYFWPSREREWWLAIRAFNVELHLVDTSTTQPAIAAMRFQFWRDALSAIYGEKPVPQHPVAQALADVRKSRPVMKYYLSQLIDARAKSLSAPVAAPTLEAYLTSHSVPSALLQGSLPLLLPPNNEATGHIAHTLSHVAHLLSVTSLLRSLPVLVPKKQLSLPMDIAAKYDVVEEDVFRNGATAHGFRDAVFEVATRGIDELITARTDLKKDNGKVVPAVTMPLFLSAVPAERYLKTLESVDFDVFSPKLLKHDWKVAPMIWWTYQRGKL